MTVSPLAPVFSLALAAACWFFVFNRPARQRYLRHHYEHEGMNEEEKEMNDAVRYAFLLVLALTFSVVGVASLVALVVQLFG